MSDPIKNLLFASQFPRASRYDSHWVLKNQMGLNPLWLTEWLCQGIYLRPGMRVLDLGCSKALSSIFLAREYEAEVWATDLWVPATENRLRIEQAILSGRIFPIHAVMRSLPFAEEFFDAIVCVDAYIYFGTDDLYLDYLHKFIKPGGGIGKVVPVFMQELEGPLPEHLLPFWAQECWTWHPWSGGSGCGTPTAWWKYNSRRICRRVGSYGCSGRRPVTWRGIPARSWSTISRFWRRMPGAIWAGSA